MGQNLGLFLQIVGYIGTDFQAGESDGFMGVFLCVTGGPSNGARAPLPA